MSDQAIKIFKALSDVDEELLERCNQESVRKNGTVYRLFQRYGRAMAAGICLMVVGAVSWGGYLLGAKNAAADSSNGAPAELSQMAQSMVAADGEADYGAMTTGSTGEEAAAGVAESALDGAGSSAVSNKKFSEETETEKGTDGIRTEATSVSGELSMPIGSANQQAMQEQQNQMSADKIDRLKESELALSDSREAISWEEACATEPFNRYLPTVLPADYAAFSARRSSSPDSWDNIIFKWTDGEHILWLNMTQGEVVTREDIERRDGLNEYVAEDFRKELIPAVYPAEDPITFTLYYADGMRIDFSGYITAEEMWEVVESVKK